jgi:nitroimidazol reductase NimA-like FMN-containing flavoprotein (pyridoxamine 5'-phosphate oxidase superfamily)
MVIRELSEEECLQVLAKARLARLACAYENQPYVVPVYLAYYERTGDAPCLYGYTPPGMKVEWMRANPLVCVEVDEVTAFNQWLSVVAFGRYEELPENLACDDERLLAHRVLQAQAMWWEPGAAVFHARNHHQATEPFMTIYYKVRIDQVTGRRATRLATPQAAPHWKLGWLRRILTRRSAGE